MKLKQAIQLAIDTMERRRWTFSAGWSLYSEGERMPWIIEECEKWNELNEAIVLLGGLIKEAKDD